MGVSKNSFFFPPKSSILIGLVFPYFHHPILAEKPTIFGLTPTIFSCKQLGLLYVGMFLRLRMDSRFLRLRMDVEITREHPEVEIFSISS